MNVMVRIVSYLYNLVAFSWCLTSVVFVFIGTGLQVRFLRD